jgi:ATP-dependent RNA helicase DeaD
MGKEYFKKVDGTMNFKELELSTTILSSISEMGFETPTKVQEEVIPLILEENDLIVMAKTGSGKTGAFGLPILHMLEKEIMEAEKSSEIEKKPSSRGPKALILTPTRELAVQVDSDIQKMSKYMNIKTTAVYGQHNIDQEMSELKEGISILTGTPGRVNDHIERKTLITKNIEFLVLDEADRMLDMGFYDQVMDIIKTLPRNRITLLFSATMPPEIKRICKEYMKHPVTVELDSDTKTVDSIKQLYHRVDQDKKRLSLERIIRVEQPDSCMVFCNTRHEVDKVTEFLQKQGFFAKALHGAKDQNSRLKTINSFRDGHIQILVATDVAARGIHIDDLTMVINYDIPDKLDSYVHRIGRTGRAGNGGLAINMVTSDDIMTLYDLEVHVGCLIEEVDLPSDEAYEYAKNNITGRWANKVYVMLPSDHLQKRSQDKAVVRGQSQRRPQQQGDRRPQKQDDRRPQKQDSKCTQNQEDRKPQRIHDTPYSKKVSPRTQVMPVQEDDLIEYEVPVQVKAPVKDEDFRLPHQVKKQSHKTNKYSTKYAVIDRTEEHKHKYFEDKIESSKGLKKLLYTWLKSIQKVNKK